MRSRIQLGILCAAMLFGGAALVVSTASAQDSAPPPAPEHPQAAAQNPSGKGRRAPNPERRTKRLKEQLGLSDTQATQVKAILEDERTKSQTLQADQTVAHDAMPAKMAQIRKDSDTRIVAILTPNQKTKWDAMPAQQRRSPGGPPPGSTPPQPPPPQR